MSSSAPEQGGGETARGADSVLALLGAVSQPVLVTDEAGRIRYINDAAYDLFGRGRGELTGQPESGLAPHGGALASREIDGEVLRTGEAREFEEQWTDGSGSVRTLLVRKTRTVIGEGDREERLVVSSITDTTQLRDTLEALRDSDTRFRAMADDAPVMIWVTDASGASIMYNSLWTQTTGQSEAEALGLGWLDALHPDDRERVATNFEVNSRNHQPIQVEYRLRRADGSLAWVLDTGKPRFSADGIFLGYVGSILDITERREMETALQASESRLAVVFAQTMVGILHRDIDGHVLMVNQRFCDIIGRTKEEIEGNPMPAFIHPDDRLQVLDVWFRHLESGKPFQLETRYLRPDGAAVWCAVNVSFILEGGKAKSSIAFVEDISERRQVEEDHRVAQSQIAHMARHDMLTGVPNRAYFLERLARALENTRADLFTAVLCLDLDGFKAVNDTFGHPTGDALLRSVAHRLQGCVRPTDIVARFGGDEFAVLLVEMEEKTHATRLAQRILDTLAAPYDIDGVSVLVGVSVGLSIAPTDADTSDDLLRTADIALYQAKARGRGVYCMFDRSMHERLLTRQATKQALTGAIARGELELFYQPLVDVNTRNINAFEALARWRHPDRGIVPPAEFIQIAEESGLIVAMGEWILEKACRQATNWPESISVAVNLSPVQFRSRRLIEAVQRALSLSGLSSKRLQLEITESVLLDDNEGNLRALQSLRKLGAMIVMDDFGTGYSSLGYLRSFPFDKIKVDREFVRDLPHGEGSLAILRAVSSLGRSLSVMTTVEGVETIEQLEAVRAEGFMEAQGFLFGEPVPDTELPHLISLQPLGPELPAAAAGGT